MSEDERNDRPGYPDVEKVDDDKYALYIPIPGDVDGSRGPSHQGGIVEVYLTANQLNEWINKLSQSMAEFETE